MVDGSYVKSKIRKAIQETKKKRAEARWYLLLFQGNTFYLMTMTVNQGINSFRKV